MHVDLGTAVGASEAGYAKREHALVEIPMNKVVGTARRKNVPVRPENARGSGFGASWASGLLRRER